MSQLKKLAGQTAIYGLPTIVGRLLNYFLVPFYTRILLREEYGIVTEMFAYTAVFMVLLTYGMETAFFRYSQQKENKQEVYNTSFLSVLFTSACFLILCFGFRGSISEIFGSASYQNYVLIMAAVLALDALRSILFARLRQQGKAFRFAAVKSTEIVFSIAFNFFFLLGCPYLLKHTDGWIYSFVEAIYNPKDQVLYIFVSTLLANIVSFLMMIPEVLAVQLKMNRKLWGEMLKYGLPVMFAGLAGNCNEFFDRIILKYLIPADENPMAQLGIYGACYKISIIMSLFIQAFRFAAEPFFFERAKHSDARQTYANVMKYFVIICSVIFLGVMMYIDVVMLFVGEPYRVGASVVPILLMANLFLGIYYNLSIWYKLTDKTIWGAYFLFIGSVITIALNFILIPYLGYLGSAWATLACHFSVTVINYFVGQKKYPVPYQSKRILFYILLATGLYLVSSFIKVESTALHYTINTLFLLAFLAVAYYLDFRGKKIIGIGV